MRAGPRVVLTILICTLCVGLWGTERLTWEQFWEYFLVINGFNWMLLLVNKKWEKAIMTKVRLAEKKGLNWANNLVRTVWDALTATVRFLRSLGGGDDLPRVLDV